MKQHCDLATELRPLLYWRTLRVEAEATASASGTTWLAAWPKPERDIEMTADNDNEAPPTEIELELSEDTAEALLRRMDGVETANGPDGRTIIVGGDVEYSRTTGRLIRAGNLVFADFTKRRQPFSKSPRAGELLGARLPSGRLVPLDVKTRFRPRSTLPPPPAPAPLSAQAGCEARSEIAALLSIMDTRDVRVLDAALQSQNLNALGSQLGYSGDYARKAAKRDLRKAVAALNEARKEIAKKSAA